MTLTLLRCPNSDCGNGIEFEQATGTAETGMVLRCRLCSEVFLHAPDTRADERQMPVIGADLLAICPADPGGRDEILTRYGLQSG